MRGLSRIAGVVLLVFGVSSGAALGVTIVTSGVDFFATPAGDADFTFSFGIGTIIPADFFGPGSDPFEGTVEFVGVPIDPANLGNTDTIVRRLEDTTDLEGGPSTIDIEIVSLRLVSVSPITVTFNGGQDPETWDVKVCLSDLEAQETGTMTITKTHTDGGLFDSVIPLRMRIDFTEVGDTGSGSIYTTFDFGDGFDLVATDSSWALLGGPTHNLTKASFGLVDFDVPINFDGDCDGVDEALLSATDDDSNFAAAIDANQAEPNCDPNSEAERAFANGAGNHDAYLASTDDSDGDGIPDECEGACCLGDKTCTLETPDQCTALGGAFKGKGLECGPVIKCLKPDGTIEISAELCCDQQGGIEIPTVSEWGLVALTLVLLTAGTIVLRRRAVAA